MYLAAAPGAIALSSFSPMFDGGTLTVYAGTIPATAETALDGTNSVLVTYTFSDPAFGAVSTGGGYNTQTASFVSSTASPGNSGVATFARATFVSTIWAGSTGYAVGDIVSKGGNYYVCILAGTSDVTGPTSTGLAQADGTTAWSYIGPTTGGTVLSQMTVGTGGNADILLSNTNIQVGTTVTITSLALQLAVN